MLIGPYLLSLCDVSARRSGTGYDKSSELAVTVSVTMDAGQHVKEEQDEHLHVLHPTSVLDTLGWPVGPYVSHLFTW